MQTKPKTAENTPKKVFKISRPTKQSPKENKVTSNSFFTKQIQLYKQQHHEYKT